MTKLNQVIAVEKTVKSRVHTELSELYKLVQKPVLFEGFNKVYQPLQEEGEKVPPQNQKVQYTVDVLTQIVSLKLSELMDVTAQKDFGNCNACADLVVDGQTLLTGVPATYLLFLEKQLTDIHTFVSKLPTLDPSEEWTFDPNSGLNRSGTNKTSRTKKVQKPVVLIAPTPEHPGQAVLVTEDEVVGYYDHTRLSGAIGSPKKQRLLERVEKLQKATKFAREAANEVKVTDRKVADPVLSYLFKE